MESRGEKLTAYAAGLFLLALGCLNRLYRDASRSGLSMFSREAMEAGWPYWAGLVCGLLAFVGYWIYAVTRK
jgi:hypothetical protein